MPGRTRTRTGFHPPSLLGSLVSWLRGHEELFVQPAESLPRLFIVYPRGKRAHAELLAAVYTHTLPGLPEELRERYYAMLRRLPPVIVVELRAWNTCDCLGHVHPAGAESRVTRRLASDLGGSVAEIDLAYKAIERWRPQPIASLAAGDAVAGFEQYHLKAALLCVLLHELDHIADPEKRERDVRSESNEFYSKVLRTMIEEDTGTPYGIE